MAKSGARNKTAICIVHLGPWPHWIGAFLKSCTLNSHFDWQLYGDHLLNASVPANVRFVQIEIVDYLALIRQKIGIQLDPKVLSSNPYKLIDFKPAVGLLFETQLYGYDAFGFGDIDVIYGDLKYFSDFLSNGYRAFSTLTWGLSGHFSLFENSDEMRKAFMRVPDWKKYLSDPNHTRFDEDHFITAFLTDEEAKLQSICGLPNVSTLRRNQIFLREQYTTPLIPWPWVNGRIDHPTVWYWWKGRVFNEHDLPRDFIYFHFMNYKFARYMDPKYGPSAPWEGKKVSWQSELAYQDGFAIDFNGFRSLSTSERDRLTEIPERSTEPLVF